MSQNATTAMRVAFRTTPEEPAALGKEARRRSPRSGHAVYKPSPDRPDPLPILEAQSARSTEHSPPSRRHTLTGTSATTNPSLTRYARGRLPAEELPAA